MSMMHLLFSSRSWWADAIVAWQPYSASSDKCTAVHTRILVNYIHRLMSIDNTVVTDKQFHCFSEIYLKNSNIKNNRFG